MKTKLKFLAVVAFAIGTTVQMSAQGYIVPNGITPFTFGSSFGVQIIQNPSDGDYTGFLLETRGQVANTFLFDPFADEGVRVFRVSLNDPISLQPILAGSYPELTFPNMYSFPNFSTFYLGFYTGDAYPVNGIYSDPLFGWGRFRNVNGTISLLDGALEYGGGGIIAGTQTILPVPEPSTWALLTLGSALLWSCALRRKK